MHTITCVWSLPRIIHRLSRLEQHKVKHNVSSAAHSSTFVLYRWSRLNIIKVYTFGNILLLANLFYTNFFHSLQTSGFALCVLLDFNNNMCENMREGGTGFGYLKDLSFFLIFLFLNFSNNAIWVWSFTYPGWFCLLQHTYVSFLNKLVLKYLKIQVSILVK